MSPVLLRTVRIELRVGAHRRIVKLKSKPPLMRRCSSIREINRINERELQLGIKGSWHDEYKGV